MVSDSEIAEVVAGALIRFKGREWTALMVGKETLPPEAAVIHRGEMILRYALAFLFEPDWLLPHVVIDDFGRKHEGRAALDFMERQGERFPRADVTGWRVVAGKSDVVFLKHLDIARSCGVFAYEGSEIKTPLARIDAAVWVDVGVTGWARLGEDDGRVPELLGRSIGCYTLSPGELGDLGMLMDQWVR
jgi:hypothetical protein